MRRDDTAAAAVEWPVTAMSRNSGDQALREAVLDYYDAERAGLERYLFFQGVDPESARDLVHDTFVKLYDHLRALGDHSNLRAWLYKVALNLARNRRSSAAQSRTVPILDMEFLDGRNSPEDLAVAAERQRKLAAAMDELSPAQRQSVLLRAQGFKYRDIAAILDLSVSAVAENVQRGVARLRTAI